MIRRKQLKRALRRFTERRRIQKNLRLAAANQARPGPPAVDPVWPLPRDPRGPGDEEIRRAFGAHERWFYGFEFEGGPGFPGRPGSIGRRGMVDPQRPLQRFRHFMPWLLDAAGGSLRGKRVLDIACNAGFWSIQCGLLGAEQVVGFDGRADLVEQANLVKMIVGLRNVEFRVLDFWRMNPDALGGKFDVVLNLGILYHLPKPVEALELTRLMAREYILLDTALHAARAPMLLLAWEEPEDIGSAVRPGVVMFPSKRGVEMMLRHVGLTDWDAIPLRTTAMPDVYLRDERASWLIRVGGGGR